ncbi:MAG: hypothetical protein QXR96_01325 [Candidatus Woesearchaeota archaeon]
MKKISKRFFILIAFFVLFSAILMSCTKKAEQNMEKEVKQTTEQKTEKSTETKIETNKTKTSSQETEETLANVLPDGVYSVERQYTQPEGKDTIKITFELKQDKIVKAEIKAIKAHETSLGYINKVNKALPDLVVGKNLKDINLPDKISGASLTTPVVKNYLKELQSA